MRPPTAPSRFGPPNSSGCCFGEAAAGLPRMAISYTSSAWFSTRIEILGVDPGLRNTGWGVIEVCGSRLSYVSCGSIRTDAQASLAKRLAAIHTGLTDIIEGRSPQEAAVEETFVNRDPQSTLKLGQARGAAISALALKGLPVSEYAANLIKKTVVGVGHAEKAQVAMMVRMLLPTPTPGVRCRRRACGRDLPRPASDGAGEGRGMIGKLRGVVDSVQPGRPILDVNGVGYLVAASARTLRALPQRGEAAELLIETHVREDAIELYGFLTAGRTRLVPPAAERRRASAPRSALASGALTGTTPLRQTASPPPAQAKARRPRARV